jgi:hypothetical protein
LTAKMLPDVLLYRLSIGAVPSPGAGAKSAEDVDQNDVKETTKELGSH